MASLGNAKGSPARSYAKVPQAFQELHGRDSSRGSEAPPEGGHTSWAHIALGLACGGLILAAASLALSSRSDAQGQDSGVSSSYATSAVLVAPNLRSTTAVETVKQLRQNAVKGGGFREGPSLWCFALMLPWGYEPGLLSAQRNAGIGVFACNEFSVFSNATYPVKETNQTLMKPATTEEVERSKRGELPMTTLPIGGDLFVEFGGKWWTAMNTDIFIRVWATVIKLGAWKQHRWTVKADPDTVFFPARLRQMVVDEPSGPVYLNNCKFGLHGPVEVLSREGLRAYADQPSACEHIRTAAMDMGGPVDTMEAAFGEDEFLKRCLDNIGVRRVDEFGLLLSETACGQETVPCGDGKVSFHPFKTTQDYFDCWGVGSISGKAWDAAISVAPMPHLVPREVRLIP